MEARIVIRKVEGGYSFIIKHTNGSYIGKTVFKKHAYAQSRAVDTVITLGLGKIKEIIDE